MEQRWTGYLSRVTAVFLSLHDVSTHFCVIFEANSRSSGSCSFSCILQSPGDRAHKSNTGQYLNHEFALRVAFPTIYQRHLSITSYSVRISGSRLNFLVVRMQSLLTALWISLLMACNVRWSAGFLWLCISSGIHPIHLWRSSSSGNVHTICAGSGPLVVSLWVLNSFTWSWNTGTLIPQKN